MLQKLSRFSK